jgi:SOS-response transcriptional repressor LexA
MIVLMPANPKYMPIYVQEGDDFWVFGVVTFVIQKPR